MHVPMILRGPFLCTASLDPNRVTLRVSTLASWGGVRVWAVVHTIHGTIHTRLVERATTTMVAVWLKPINSIFVCALFVRLQYHREQKWQSNDKEDIALNYGSGARIDARGDDSTDEHHTAWSSHANQTIGSTFFGHLAQGEESVTTCRCSGTTSDAPAAAHDH